MVLTVRALAVSASASVSCDSPLSLEPRLNLLQWDAIRTMTGLRGNFYPVCNRYAKGMVNLHRGHINGRHRLSVDILSLRFNSYVNADGWDDLLHVFTEPLKSSPLDELILLLHTATPGSDKPHPKYARPVSYNRLDEVPELLLSIIPSALRTDVTATDKRRPRGEVATGNHGGQGQQNRVGMPEERITGGKGAEGFMPGGRHEEKLCQTRINAARVVQNAYRRHLERKRAGAARKIQAACRCHLKEKSIVREGIDAAQAHYWHLLRKRSMEMKWADGSRYYLLFRVPLAYIPVCLDEIKVFAESQKKGAKKRMMTEDHRGLEELMEALNQYGYDNAKHIILRV